jgi:purine-nucleoside phosphorylase
MTQSHPQPPARGDARDERDAAPVPTTAAPSAVAASAQALRALGPVPAVAVLLGSGWGGFADRLAHPRDLAYAELPAFPAIGIGGHAGRVVHGWLGQRPVLALAGRRHAYEGGRADGMTGAVRALAAAGVQVLVQTNAAGSLDAAMPPGALMLVEDHLNLPQRSPLWEERDDRRFVDLSAAYDPALRALAQRAAAAAGHRLHAGVYAWVVGPQFETPAEIRMLQRLGADAVGMSTVPETIAARHAGLRVLALSLITNLAAGLQALALSHAHTLAQAQVAGASACDALVAVVGALLEPGALGPTEAGTGA